MNQTHTLALREENATQGATSEKSLLFSISPRPTGDWRLKRRRRKEKGKKRWLYLSPPSEWCCGDGLSCTGFPPLSAIALQRGRGEPPLGGGEGKTWERTQAMGPLHPERRAAATTRKKRRRECVCVSVGCCCCCSRRRHNHINNNACGGEERTDGRARSVFECMLERQHKLNSLTKLCIAWYSSMVQNKPLFMPNLLPPSRVVSRRFQAPQVLFLSFPPLR